MSRCFGQYNPNHVHCESLCEDMGECVQLKHATQDKDIEGCVIIQDEGGGHYVQRAVCRQRWIVDKADVKNLPTDIAQRLQVLEEFVFYSHNRYRCLGETPHPGCSKWCIYHATCADLRRQGNQEANDHIVDVTGCVVEAAQWI